MVRSNNGYNKGLLTFIAAIALALGGCASQLPQQNQISESTASRALPAAPPEGLANIYLLRSSQLSGSATNVTAYVDEPSEANKAGSLRVGQYVYFPIRAEAATVYVTQTLNGTTSISVNPSENESIFLYTRLTTFSGPELTQIDPAVGRQMLFEQGYSLGNLENQEMLAQRQRNRPGQLTSAIAEHSESLDAAAMPELDTLVINDNSGAVLSPYTSDGVTAEWVNQSINARMGSAVGSAMGAEVGRRAASNVPFVGSFLGSQAGASVGRQFAIDMDLVRSTSDKSFNNLNDMARYLVVHYGQNANFAEVVQATEAVFPGFQQSVQRQLR